MRFFDAWDTLPDTFHICYMNNSPFLVFNWVNISIDFQRNQIQRPQKLLRLKTEKKLKCILKSGSLAPLGDALLIYCCWNSWYLLFSIITTHLLIFIMINRQIAQLRPLWYCIFMIFVLHSKSNFKLSKKNHSNFL